MNSKHKNLVDANIHINWLLITHKDYPLFSRYWVNESFRIDMKDALGLGFRNYKSLYSGIYADKNEFDKLKMLLISKLESDTEEIWKLCEQWEARCKEVVEFSKKVPSSINKISDQELLNYIETVITKLRQSVAYIFLHHILDHYFENKINTILNNRNIPEIDRNPYFQALATSNKKSGIKKSQRDLLILNEKVKKYGIKSCQKLISEYAIKYAWLGYDTAIGKNLSVLSIKEMISEHNLIKSENTLRRAKVEARLHLTPEENDLINLVGEISYLGTYRIESNARVGVYFRPILEELAKRLDSTYEELVRFTLPEIKKFILMRKVDKKLVRDREQKYGLITINGIHHIVSGGEVDKFEPVSTYQRNIINVLKGLTVSMGKVIGPAKIVLNKSDLTKIKHGDILVTKMTNPDYIPALRKCAAIVTDIGGITSHAAIISREIGKPCITGTKIATQILHDEDIIEVDAVSGIVRRL